jgi:hypothetical protein
MADQTLRNLEQKDLAKHESPTWPRNDDTKEEQQWRRRHHLELKSERWTLPGEQNPIRENHEVHSPSILGSPDSTIIIQRCSFSRIDSPIGCSLKILQTLSKF